MKKYSVYNLFVVAVQHDSGTYYLICQHNDLSDTYVEIFTNEKIKITDDSNIELLSNYYSILTRRNYATKKPLMLDKKELLRKYIDINSEASLEKDKAFSKSENILSKKMI